LSQELIVDTAMTILAADGLDAVSMRRVAQELNTGPASLYAHVSNKDELSELMFDRMLGEVELPEPDPDRWREQLRELCRAQVLAMTRYPGIARIVMDTMIPVGPNALRHAEGALAILRAGGLSERAAAFAFDALGLYVKAYAQEASGWRHGALNTDELAQRQRMVADYVSSLPPATFANLLSIGRYINAESATARFEYAIDAFIEGIRPK
jgi:AcrR family transcriptional regulator